MFFTVPPTLLAVNNSVSPRFRRNHPERDIFLMLSFLLLLKRLQLSVSASLAVSTSSSLFVRAKLGQATLATKTTSRHCRTAFVPLFSPRNFRHDRPNSPLQTSVRRSSTCAAILGDIDDEIENFSSPSAPALGKNCQSRPKKLHGQFEVTAPYVPTGDQPTAISQLVQQIQEGDKHSVLRGVTGTGKTFVISHVIAKLNRPTLVLCHNKTLAAQLARELRSFFKNNAVELFVSYYDHYIPESFVETTGTYIAKKSKVNDEIDSLRHRATRALLERRDVVVVASVSCIYGLGLPAEYLDASVSISVSDQGGGCEEEEAIQVDELVDKLESMLYSRPENGEDMLRGNYVLSESVTSEGEKLDVVTLWPPHEKFPVRIAFQYKKGKTRSFVRSIHQTTEQDGLVELDSLRIFPAKHHVMSDERLEEACLAIEEEMKDRVKELTLDGKFVEAQRLQQRVMNDLLMLRETGFCSGGENYSRHFAGRKPGEPPDTLIDYMHFAGRDERDWLLVVDESHVTLPQLKAMYTGDRARKKRLVKHGFRLPSALDNRPLKHDEFWEKVPQSLFVSATPSRHELALAKRKPISMIIRPTYVCDPIIHVRSPEGQLDNLLQEVRKRASRDERTLAVALTKRDAEDLASFLQDNGVKATYIHSGLPTVERADALKALQSGSVDCLVGVNLLREGLDLPQVSLVAVLNADSEGFLRCETSLLQTVGRAARNINGEAIFYANRVTSSMQRCMADTKMRRERQLSYNIEYGRESQSTKGSNMLSIFDLLREENHDKALTTVLDAENSPSPVTLGLLPGESTVGLLFPSITKGPSGSLMTDHLPSKPGVYFWKDGSGKVLYIGKAKRIRTRVKSYLSPGAKHSPRIKAMLEHARCIDFLLTPSDRDASVLESNLIKLHQPPYNVLLKDDKTYPYVCASIGDPFPRFFAVPRKFSSEVDERASKYRYFGPYPHYSEINSVLEAIEERYDLRAKSFAARHGNGCRKEYNSIFQKALREVFERNGEPEGDDNLPLMRAEFEEAGMLFDSIYNNCRDVVALELDENDKKKAVVHVLQLRSGLVAGRFDYGCEIPSGLTSVEDCSVALQTVLERKHYSAAEECSYGRFSFFPDEVLTQYPLNDPASFKQSFRAFRRFAEPSRKGAVAVRTPSTRGPRKETDQRAMAFATVNAKQAATDCTRIAVSGAAGSSLDGTALGEIAELLELDKSDIRRIECFDISHTHGDATVGSRVVFIDGKPAPHLYRLFNVKTVKGVDDYASLEEVLRRRFQRIWCDDGGLVSDDDEAWTLPDLVVVDGGPGQLGAAIRGMAEANVYPTRRVEERSDGVVESGISFKNIVLGGADAFNDTLGSSKGLPTGRVSVPICALAKNHEEVFVHGIKDPLNRSTDTPALLLLRAIRDESHRFALNAHRRRRAVQGGLR